jgi:hypothetical protein
VQLIDDGVLEPKLVGFKAWLKPVSRKHVHDTISR